MLSGHCASRGASGRPELPRLQISTGHYAANETAVEKAAPLEDTWEADLTSPELKFQEACSDPTEMRALRLQEADTTRCDEMASSELAPAFVGAVSTQRGGNSPPSLKLRPL